MRYLLYMNNKKHNKRINYSNSLKVAIIFLGTMGRCVNAGLDHSESSNTSDPVLKYIDNIMSTMSNTSDPVLKYIDDIMSTMKNNLHAALMREEKEPDT